MKIIGIGNAIVDVICKVSDDFLEKHSLIKSTMKLIDENEFHFMKNGCGLINAARGGVVNENGLIKALDEEKLAFAGIDTFVNEPKPSLKLLMHPKVSLSPHIGAATLEAQDRIGIELANQIISLVK